ncbi:HNH endonuclease [Aliinostoc sp. HNIBRCY26]|uniref:HNH endonuclease n=1 Tax=Aliinostoc sp. HNIBRCY26 TaxID=3418997 RepID=UPI003D05CB52
MSNKRVTTQQKKLVATRAKGCCEYCKSQERFAMQAFAAEHIIPRSQAGETSLDNLALSCQGCNNHKYNKIQGSDPVSGEIVLLFNPRQQLWDENFTWNHDFTLVIGLTPTGRATVETLQLNREGVVNLRRVLYSIGEHPPSD